VSSRLAGPQADRSSYCSCGGPRGSDGAAGLAARARPTNVAVKDPLEILIAGQPPDDAHPGNDEELAPEFLYGEGLIDGPRDGGSTDDFAANTVEVPGGCWRARDTAVS
jgi:hypothetical protein